MQSGTFHHLPFLTCGDDQTTWDMGHGSQVIWEVGCGGWAMWEMGCMARQCGRVARHMGHGPWWLCDIVDGLRGQAMWEVAAG